MGNSLKNFYDNATGFFLTLAFLVGLIIGGVAAYKRAPAVPDVEDFSLSPAPSVNVVETEIPSTPITAETEQSPGRADLQLELEISLVYEDSAGFTSKPLMDQTGNLFISANSQLLYSVQSDGSNRWQVELPAKPVGNLIWSNAQEIIVVDRDGRLAAYSQEGSELWSYLPQEKAIGVSGAVAGPEGGLYYMLEIARTGYLQALNADGTQRWRAPVENVSYRTEPWVYPDGSHVFLKNEAFKAADGAPVPLEYPVEIERFFTGLDGRAYAQRGSTITAWEIEGNRVLILDDAPRFLLPDHGFQILDAQINSTGLSWMSFSGNNSDGLYWFDGQGSILHQITTANLRLRSILAMNPSGTIFACGLKPRNVTPATMNQRTSQCEAYHPGDKEAFWRESLSSKAETILGSVLYEEAVLFSTETGALYRISSAPPQATAEADFAGAEALPNGWYWKIPEKSIRGPMSLADGTLVFLTEEGTVYYLNSDGSAKTSLQLPDPEEDKTYLDYSFFFRDDGTVTMHGSESIKAFHPDQGLIWEFEVAFNLRDPLSQLFNLQNIILQFKGPATLYAFNPTGGYQWEYTLENGLREDYVSTLVSDKVLYIVDRTGKLYAFNQNGLEWSFSPEDQRRTASNPVLGPDGNIYYTLTSGSIGYLQSVTPDGVGRWSTELETFHFFQEPAFSAESLFARIDSDFVRLENGALTQVEIPFDVRAFFNGENGMNYLITGSHLIQWQIGPEGYEQLQDHTINLDGFQNRFTPFSRVYSTGLIELLTRNQGNMQLTWLNPASEEMIFFQIAQSQVRFDSGSRQPEHLFCNQDPVTFDLNCVKYVPGYPDPIWELTIEGLAAEIMTHPQPIWYDNSKLHVFAGNQYFYVFNLEIPR